MLTSKIPMNHNARSILFDTSETVEYCKGTTFGVMRKYFLIHLQPFNFYLYDSKSLQGIVQFDFLKK